jgi:hypothetical protein
MSLCCHFCEYFYAEYHLAIQDIIVLSGVFLNVVLLSGVFLNVVLLSVFIQSVIMMSVIILVLC